MPLGYLPLPTIGVPIAGLPIRRLYSSNSLTPSYTAAHSPAVRATRRSVAPPLASLAQNPRHPPYHLCEPLHFFHRKRAAQDTLHSVGRPLSEDLVAGQSVVPGDGGDVRPVGSVVDESIKNSAAQRRDNGAVSTFGIWICRDSLGGIGSNSTERTWETGLPRAIGHRGDRSRYGVGVYTRTRLIMAAEMRRVAAMTRKTMGQGLPVMSRRTLNISAWAPA